jgi:hypothetical protein
MQGRGAAQAIGLALAMSSAPAAQAQHWDVQMPGMSHHFERPRKRGAVWNERHDGFGLQRTVELDAARLHAGWVWRESAGVMVDSFGNPGAYAGAGLAWRQRRARFDVDAGLAPMLLYRTTRFDDWRGPAPLKLIPAVLPTFSLQHRPSGTGANIIAVPALTMGADFRMPGLVFVQLTRRLD